MTKVTIYTKDGDVQYVTCTKAEEEFYDNLPFTSENVTHTIVEP